MADPRPVIRADKWLWQARFCKSRTLAAELISSGQVRLNGNRITKPAHPVGPGDVLTFALSARIRVIRVAAIGQRRGPASEAALLYVDLDPGQSSHADGARTD